MEHNQPSRTAQGAALFRAAHQLVDDPPVFCDPLATTIIGPEAASELRARLEEARDRAPGLRAFIAARSRFTEDCLIEAMARGVRQYVLLGAGLDTFAYRKAQPELRVFEIDYAATQSWKRARLADVRIAIPDGVTFAPIDFERETLREALARVRFEFSAPALFAWLGVTPYLTREAVMDTLGFIAMLARNSEIVFDYATSPKNAEHAQRQQFDALAERVAAAGEPFQSQFDPAELRRALMTLGFSHVMDLDSEALNKRFFQNRSDGLRLRGLAHLMRARI